MSRMALRKVVWGKPARSVGQPIRATSGMPPMVRIPPSVRTTSDSCRRAINGFCTAATAAGFCGCRGGSAATGFEGGAGALVSERTGCGSLVSGDNRLAAMVKADAANAPSMKPTIAIMLMAGGKVRRCGTVASPMMRALEVLRLSCSSVSRERLRKD
jgi:hypothetical protein